MRILGIDPGTATTGWGVIDVENNEITVSEFGLIETDKELTTYIRLQIIYKEMLKLLKLHKPDVMAIEKIFFATNAKTAISVGQAQGVMFLSASISKTPVFEYAPGTIKKRIAGNGRADKKDVQRAVREILGPKVKSPAHQKTHFDNSADALAIAMCHAIALNENLLTK